MTRSEPVSVPRALRNALVFAVAFALTTTGLGRAMRSVPDVRIESPPALYGKYQHYREHADRIDVVFVGSSRVLRHLAPAVFDETLAKRGYELRSYNFGHQGMWMPETFHTLDWILEQRSPKLRYLFIELQGLTKGSLGENELSQHEIQWHSAGATAIAMRAGWHAHPELGQRLASLGSHLSHFVHRSAHVGLGFPAFDALAGRNPPHDPSPTYRGFTALKVDRPGNRTDRRQDFLAHPEKLRGRIRALERMQRVSELQPYQERILRAFVERVRSAGVEPVFFISAPSEEPLPEMHAALAAGVLPNLLAYDDPRRTPELYDPANLFDIGHLNRDGALLFSARLAADFADLLDRAATR